MRTGMGKLVILPGNGLAKPSRHRKCLLIHIHTHAFIFLYTHVPFVANAFVHKLLVSSFSADDCCKRGTMLMMHGGIILFSRLYLLKNWFLKFEKRWVP